MQFSNEVGGVKYADCIIWNTSDGKTVVFRKLYDEFRNHFGIEIGRKGEMEGLDRLTDVLVKSLVEFSNENKANPYNPTSMHEILENYSKIETVLKKISTEDNFPMAFITELMYVLEKLYEIVGIYLEEFKYRSKYHEREKKSKCLEEIENYYRENDFEHTLIDQIDVRHMLSTLPVKQRNRIIKYFFEGKTLKEIAKEENVSFQSVQESIKGALKKMKMEENKFVNY